VKGLGRSLSAAAILGLASTLGDWIWARALTDGAIVPAIVHGVLIFALLAAVLGLAVEKQGAVRRLLVTAPGIGLVLAAVFYPLARVIGYLGALVVTWLGMWIALAVLTAWAAGEDQPLRRALPRGALAAVGSGLAFWLVSGMWTDPGFEGGYVMRFALWTFAFFPGFAALLARRTTLED
jgi:hypothetical protein